MPKVRSLNIDMGVNFDNKSLKSANKKVDRFKSNAKSSEKALVGVENQAKKTGNKSTSMFSKMGSSIKSGVGALQDYKYQLAGISTAIGGAFAYAIKKAGDFSSQMTRVKGIAQATSSEIDTLGDFAKETAMQTAFGANEVAQGLEFTAKAGLGIQESMDALPDILNLASSSQMELGKTSDIVTDVMSGMKIEFKETERAVDVMRATASNANTDVDQLGEALKKSGSTAESLGYNLEQTSSVLGLLADTGLKGQRAGTALRATFERLAPSSTKAKKAVEELGIEFSDGEGGFKNIGAIVKDLEDAFEGMGDQTRRTKLKDIFGRQGADVFTRLLGQSSEKLAELNQELKNSQGLTEDLAEEQIDTLNGQMKVLGGSFDVVATNTGESLVPATKELVVGLNNLLIWFNDLDDSTKRWTTGIGVVVGGLTTIATVIGFLAGPIMTFIGVLGTVGGLLATIGGALVTVGSFIVAVGQAIAIVVGGFVSMLSLPVIATIVGIGVAIGGIIWKFDELVIVAKKFAHFLKILPGVAGALFKMLGSSIASKAKDWGSSIKQGFMTGFNYIKKKGNKFLGWFKNLFTKENLKSVSVSIIKTLSSGFTKANSFILNSLKSGINKAKDFLLNTADFILPDFKIPGVDKVFNKIKSKIDWLESQLEKLDIGGSIKDGVINTKDKAVGAVGDMTQNVRDFLPFSPAKQGALSDLDKTGKGLTDTIASSIKSSKSGLVDTMGSLWDNVTPNWMSGNEGNEQSEGSTQTVKKRVRTRKSQTTNSDKSTKVDINNLNIELPQGTDVNDVNELENDMEKAVRKAWDKILNEQIVAGGSDA